ncbi:hypothetical protein BCON_0409g00090 [Botryotinia convoluta]|uniref:Uncharacterized protein n=1 Tax=Botryotinia convoluta TaxID=54673 RepID=A0A4Z1HJS4_9HELO|nr:hypothetical protein BCON_0409g00090 [Botryotinia convoluta]
MVGSTARAASLQVTRTSGSAGPSPDLIPQDTAAPETQEGKVENLNMVENTEAHATSSKTKENELQRSGSGNISPKRDALPAQVSSEYALNLFIEDPGSYFQGITVLEHRILQLGQDIFNNVKEDDETRRHVLLLRKLDVGTVPPAPFSLTFDQRLRMNRCIQLQVSTGIETLSSVIAGTRLLQDEGFCNSSAYNIIVADIERPKVLNIRQISMPSLTLLLELLREVQESNQQGDFVSEDIAEILLHIVVSLGLGIPQTVLSVEEHNLKRQQDICHLLSSILSVLHVALLSFVRSHIDISGYPPSGLLSDGLHIECPGGTLFLAARQLKCLNDLLKQPVWAFSFMSTHSTLSKVECDGFYLSSSIDHLAELWGPLRLNLTEASNASSIETHGGRLLSAEHHTSSVRPLESEVLCHWSSWMETNSLENTTPIDTAKLLLIGVRTIPQAARKCLRLPRFHTIDLCDCPDRYISQPRHREFELGTRPPNWKMKEKTAQASGGQYLTITLGLTYKFDAGWTLKDVILEDWVDAGKTDASHIPNPYLIDCLVVLDFSCCSGHARRISLWALLKVPAIRQYLYRKRNSGLDEFRDVTSLLDGLCSVDSLSSIWTTIPVTHRKLLISSFKAILKILKFTGIGDDKKLQAWDITSHDRIDGRRLDPRWSSFVKDDSNSATFAVITSTCIRYSQSNDQDLTDTVLRTQLCITAAQRIDESLGAFKEDVQMSQSMDIVSRQSAGRYQSMDSDSRQPPHADQSDVESTLLERIRNNQKRRQKGSDAASQSSFAGNDPPILASQYPSNNSSRSRKRLEPEPYNMQPSAIKYSPILPIRNGLGQKVGKLSLEPATPIDLTLLTDETTLQAKWEEISRRNLIENLKEKEAQLDKRRIAPLEEDLGPPDVVEYIRPGNLTAYQKLVTTYIH